jgi:hypothetical protein
MAIDENFLISKILELNASISQISGKIDGFLNAQTGMQAEITGIKADVASVRREVADLRQESVKSKSFIGGILAAWSAAWTGFLLFLWPYLKNKLGL